MVGTDKTVWYILTDVSDSNIAASLGLNFSAKLNFMAIASRTGNLDANGNIIFNAGTVDFSPVRNVVPGPPGAEFPPVSTQPGEIGDATASASAGLCGTSRQTLAFRWPHPSSTILSLPLCR